MIRIYCFINEEVGFNSFIVEVPMYVRTAVGGAVISDKMDLKDIKSVFLVYSIFSAPSKLFTVSTLKKFLIDNKYNHRMFFVDEEAVREYDKSQLYLKQEFNEEDIFPRDNAKYFW